MRVRTFSAARLRTRASLRATFAFACIAGALVVGPRVALANSNGSDPGCSGKTGIPNDLCTSCAGQCHTGGPKPTVAFAGPSTIDAGDTAEYTFTITTTQPQTGVDIAVTNGVTLNHGTTTQAEFGELTQPAPQAVTGGASVYTFTVVGPQYGGTIELWGSGNAVNGNGATSGDNAAEGTMTITVNGPPNPGGGGAVSDDAGSDGTGLNGGLLPDGGSTNGLIALADGGYAAPDNPGGTDGLSDDDTLHQNSGNCSVTGNDLGRAGSGLLASGLVVCGLLFAGRRRRRK